MYVFVIVFPSLPALFFFLFFPCLAYSSAPSQSAFEYRISLICYLTLDPIKFRSQLVLFLVAESSAEFYRCVWHREVLSIQKNKKSALSKVRGAFLFVDSRQPARPSRGGHKSQLLFLDGRYLNGTFLSE